MRPGARAEYDARLPRGPSLMLARFIRILAAATCVAMPLAVSGAPDVPSTPARAEILEATPFELDEPATLPGAGAAPFARGFLLVLRAAPGLTALRQPAMPIAQVGDRVLAPASRGQRGLLVAVLPGEADLGASIAFFGPPDLIERVDAGEAARRHEAARAAGLAPVGPQQALAALAAGGEPLRVRSFGDLAPAILALRCRLEPDALAAAGTPCEVAP